MKFNEVLQQLRRSHQLSQEALSERLHVSRQAVAKWEAGNTLPDLTNLLILSDLFNVSLDRLLKEENSSCSRMSLLAEEKINDDLLDFLFEAKAKTYAAGMPEDKNATRPNAHDLTYADDNLCYIDTYLGSEKFSGQEGLWKDNIPLWTMNYIGRVTGEGFSGDFLKKALTVGIKEKVFRGPEIFNEGDFTYHCDYRGDIEWFQGNESIYYLKKKVYECFFHGGIVKE